ncbi:hypothetical protein [Acidipila sp. EB88]|uniref:hypothetical protein n=1 Tax=Acidipila sp. EB88 TaxID=2305226 RepID=UPI000F5DF116|nr:hypothetical protein [Acidipila sp. EB88]
MSQSYAVLFKTHFWDDFTRRQLDRLKAVVGRGDIYVLVDETFQPAPPIAHDHVLGVTRQDIETLQLAPITTHGSILWYNIDYPHYVAFSKLPAYDYYVTIEFDANIRQSLDTLIDALARDEVDYLGFPIRKRASEWPWYSAHLDIYGPDMLVALSCFAVFSHRALALLLARRQVMSKAFAAGRLSFWPNNEAFLPNEIRNARLHMEALATYGPDKHYDWWPPLEESALDGLGEQMFVHPVLHGTRFVRSLIHHEPNLKSFLKVGTANHEKLKHFDPQLVTSLLRAESSRRWRDRFSRLLQRVRLQRKWDSNAHAKSARVAQAESLHNSG